MNSFATRSAIALISVVTTMIACSHDWEVLEPPAESTSGGSTSSSTSTSTSGAGTSTSSSGGNPTCNTSSDCPGSGQACTTAVCANGSCGYTKKPDGTLIEQGDSMDCRDKVCMNGSIENQVNGLNCNDPDTEDCLIPRCDPDGDCNTMNQSNAPAGTQCKKNDIDGNCNDQGLCITNP